MLLAESITANPNHSLNSIALLLLGEGVNPNPNHNYCTSDKFHLLYNCTSKMANKQNQRCKLFCQ